MLVLEEIYKSKKSEHSTQFNLRIQRGLSWLKKAVLLDDELDLKLISLWIGFNAIYTQEVETIQDKQIFRAYLNQIYLLDQDHKIHNLIWGRLSQPITLLIENIYTYQLFWDCQNQKKIQKIWKNAFESEQREIEEIRHNQNTVDLLLVIFSRLNTLYQQIMQGGSTYNSMVNRKQLKDGCMIFTALLPEFIYILLENADVLDSKKSFYPVLQMS